MNYDVLSNIRGGFRNATTTGASAEAATNQRPSALTVPQQHQQHVATAARSNNDEFKGKLMSMWNNMKFGWSSVRTRTNFSHEQPVWVLGRVYHRKASPAAEPEQPILFEAATEGQIPEEPVALPLSASSPVEELGQDAIEDTGSPDSLNEDEGIDGFKRDFVSRLWMTYRKEFPTMNGSNFTSDCGWGCMIRSGQMLLAEGFVRHFLGRGWRYDPDMPINTQYEEAMHRKIIRWFGDVQSKNSPFSIHNLVALSKAAGKKPGDWYGPGAVAHLMRQAFKLAAADNADLENLNVYVAQDCAVYLQDIFDECIVDRGRHAPWTMQASPNKSAHWRSLVLLVPLRLGTERLNQIYGDCLKAMLGQDYCIGIIGGRPKHSLYFVGYQEDKLINLDPHYCQDMVNVLEDTFDVTSFHCRSPRKMKLAKMDPSCCIGFYCKTRTDFEKFVTEVQRYLLPCKNWMDKQMEGHAREYCGPDRSYPMFVFCEGRSRDQQHSAEISRIFRSPPASMSQSAYTTDDDDDGIEEFVII